MIGIIVKVCRIMFRFGSYVDKLRGLLLNSGCFKDLWLYDMRSYCRFGGVDELSGELHFVVGIGVTYVDNEIFIFISI